MYCSALHARGAILAGIAAVTSLAGCVALPPAAPEEPAGEFVVDEDAFQAAILPGFVDPETATDVEESTLNAGQLACEGVSIGISRDELVAEAAEAITTSPAFNSRMPELLVDSALTYLCDVQ